MPEEKNQNQQSQTPSSKPAWLLKYKKRLSFIDVFYKAFTHNCDCVVCRMIRENMKYWEEFLKPKTEG